MAENHSSLTIVMPCFNEEASLRTFLPSVLDFAGKNSWKVIVINDGSTDSSKLILSELDREYSNIEVITHNVNKGYGAALKSGITNSMTEFTATMDADGQHFPDDIEKLLAIRNERNADMVIGSRKEAKAGGTYRSFVKWIISNL